MAAKGVKFTQYYAWCYCTPNGPWLSQKLNAGSAGLLRGKDHDLGRGRGRSHASAWWPRYDRPRPGRSGPGQRARPLRQGLSAWPAVGSGPWPYDSHSLVPLFRQARTAHATRSSTTLTIGLRPCRRGRGSCHRRTIEAASGQTKSQIQSPPLLFNVATDPSERFNVALEHPDVVERLTKVIKAHRASVSPGSPSIEPHRVTDWGAIMIRDEKVESPTDFSPRRQSASPGFVPWCVSVLAGDVLLVQAAVDDPREPRGGMEAHPTIRRGGRLGPPLDCPYYGEQANHRAA